MARASVNAAVIVGSTVTLVSSWVGIAAADARGEASDAPSAPPYAVANWAPGDVPPDQGEHLAASGSSWAAAAQPPLALSPLAPLELPDVPTVDLEALTRIDLAGSGSAAFAPLQVPRLTITAPAPQLVTASALVPAPAPRTVQTVRKSKAS